MFEKGIKSRKDLGIKFNVYRSLRRSSNTRAIEVKVAQSDIDVVNRWAQEERAGFKKASLKTMSQHYSDVKIMLGPVLRYTHAM